MSEHLPEDLREIGDRLERERPVPAAAFRGDLERRLSVVGGGAPGRVRLLVLAYSSSGLVLMAVALLGVAGAGPLSAG